MIEVVQLKKRFKLKKSEVKKRGGYEEDPRSRNGYFHSVESVSFACQKGEVLGLLGPNGAGKTTTLRLLSTALSADSGQILINGVDAVSKPLLARRKIGFLSGNTGLYGRLSAQENVRYFGKLHGLSQTTLDQRCTELFEKLEMNHFLHKRAENLSTGMKQKTAIARALIHSPDVVILDEPTTGLDIMAKQTVLNMVQLLKTQNIPVIFSTHQFDEVQLLCDSICVINQGVSQFLGAPDRFMESMNSSNFNEAFIHFISDTKGQREAGI